MEGGILGREVYPICSSWLPYLLFLVTLFALPGYQISSSWLPHTGWSAHLQYFVHILPDEAGTA